MAGSILKTVLNLIPHSHSFLDTTFELYRILIGSNDFWNK
ncbi:hypothetical protein SAMN04488029_1173 [Reichenbachiella faecimaris]|uniref:Uncharacterized protein n=1 Tax=Reichenbachiella faecimaris TaxID=692418 RepID=A0A1W2G907_REIFA|nr:hypothetical protein SAMN04488029_1173 [Reichenbachiella faecimaris]